MIDFAKYGMIVNTSVFVLEWFEVGPFKPKSQEIKQEVNNHKNKEWKLNIFGIKSSILPSSLGHFTN